MSRWLWIMMASLPFITAVSGNAFQSPSGHSSTKVTTPAVTLTEADNGKDIDLTAGTTLLVKLKGNPSTGYSWTVAGDPAPLRLQKSSFAKKSGGGQKVGASGTETLRLSASSAGMSTLTVVYRRSWEYNVPPAKTFSVRVNVR